MSKRETTKRALRPADLITVTPPTPFKPFWRASANGACEVSANSKVKALAQLALVLDTLAQHGFRRTYRFTPKGTVFTLYFWRHWCYDITAPDRDMPSTCVLNATTYDEALKAMEEDVRAFSEVE